MLNAAKTNSALLECASPVHLLAMAAVLLLQTVFSALMVLLNLEVFAKKDV